MAAYLIAEVETTNPDLMAQYRELVLPTLASFGGRFIVRGGRTETKEGDWQPQRLVVIEFPSMEQARAWYDSDAYREPKAMRMAAGNTRLLLVDGIQ